MNRDKGQSPPPAAPEIPHHGVSRGQSPLLQLRCRVPFLALAASLSAPHSTRDGPPKVRGFCSGLAARARSARAPTPRTSSCSTLHPHPHPQWRTLAAVPSCLGGCGVREGGARARQARITERRAARRRRRATVSPSAGRLACPRLGGKGRGQGDAGRGMVCPGHSVARPQRGGGCLGGGGRLCGWRGMARGVSSRA